MISLSASVRRLLGDPTLDDTELQQIYSILSSHDDTLHTLSNTSDSAHSVVSESLQSHVVSLGAGDESLEATAGNPPLPNPVTRDAKKGKPAVLVGSMGPSVAEGHTTASTSTRSLFVCDQAVSRNKAQSSQSAMPQPFQPKSYTSLQRTIPSTPSVNLFSE
ncbi:hypothetical protein Ae201684P_000850 [Aphanomyces euteiches]|nr:hypothetical protein Ae201684P_000850 [Aphanomyces euteiches]